MKQLFALLALAAPAFASDPAPAKSDTPYPIDTCVVTGEALGSMGDPYVHVHKETDKPDREVRFCCKGCLKRFNKAPAKYLAKLDAAAMPAIGQSSVPAADR
jgi:YHS domain.